LSPESASRVAASNLKAPTPVDRLLSSPTETERTREHENPGRYAHAQAVPHLRVYQTPAVPQKSSSSPALSQQKKEWAGGATAKATGSVIPVAPLALSPEMDAERKRIRERELELEMELWREEEQLRARMEELKKAAVNLGGETGGRGGGDQQVAAATTDGASRRGLGSDGQVGGVGAGREGPEGEQQRTRGADAADLIRELQEDKKRSREERSELAAEVTAALRAACSSTIPDSSNMSYSWNIPCRPPPPPPG